MARRRKRRKSGCLIFFILFLLIILAGILFLLSKLNKIQTYNLDKDNITINDINDSDMNGYTNFVLFGVDSRQNELDKNTRSDSIIIASINKSTKEVKLASIYRDTYVPIGDSGYAKINAAYAKGGPELAISTINKVWDLNITDFVTANFNAVTSIVNDLGGVEIDIQSDELKEINRYINDVNKINKTSSPHLTHAGKQTLDGTQATAYSRVRYTAGNDFRRTERQRNVIYGILNKAKSSSLSTILSVSDKILPQVYTSLSTTDIIGLAKDVFSYKIADDSGFPVDKKTGTVNRASIVLPTTLSSNVTKLHKFLFGTENYQPSSTVQSISKQLQSVRVY
ncbi:cell envelope-related function transcriptional attenuator common domain [Lachnospiraceae bacterium KM106-2]|nr:cell envelope-related function transcriptional attenuator common domain [Lachnospiraceae bacterium KM106-2]